MVSLKNKVVLITGASSGIGAAAALAFAKKGSKIVIAARRIERLNELKKKISHYTKHCICVKTDVTSEKEVKMLFERAESAFGKIDILVNAAGRGLKASILNTSAEEWSSVMRTNLDSVFICTKEAVSRMIKKKVRGRIITVVSIAGFYGTPNFSAYCASKHGALGFQQSAKWELRSKGIKVSSINPGRVNTEFFDIYDKRPGNSQMLSPDDIADSIIATASGNSLMRIIIWLRNMLKRIFRLVFS